MEISKSAFKEAGAYLEWLDRRDPDTEVAAIALMIAAAKWVSCLARSDLDLHERVGSLHTVFMIIARECFQQKCAVLAAESKAAQNNPSLN